MSKKIIGVTVGTPISLSKIGNDLKPEIKSYIDEQIGAVEAAFDEAIDLCNEYIGGDDE